MAEEKYYMYVDECGDQNLSAYDEHFPIFTLCGVIMSESQLQDIEAKVHALKDEFWGEGKTVILHSRDIRKCDKEFKILFDLKIRETFYNRIDQILGNKDAFKTVICTIRKEPYIRQFGRYNDVYGQSLGFLIERSIFYLDEIAPGSNLHIIAEMRGKKEDQNLLNYYNQLRDKGTYWVTPERMQSHILKFEFMSKKKDVTGLQLADLIAYPITQHILFPDRVNYAFDTIKDSIYNVEGKWYN